MDILYNQKLLLFTKKMIWLQPYDVAIGKFLANYFNTMATGVVAWRQTPETGSGVIAFTDLAAQLEMQNYIYRYTFCHL